MAFGMHHLCIRLGSFAGDGNHHMLHLYHGEVYPHKGVMRQHKLLYEKAHNGAGLQVHATWCMSDGFARNEEAVKEVENGG